MDKETLKNLTQLSRIHCEEKEEERLLRDLQSILNYIDQLNEVDTSNVASCAQVLVGLANVTRDDVVGDTLSRSLFLRNAPDQIGGMIRTPPVIKKH